MRLLTTLLLASLLLFSGCDQLNKAKEETIEAAENLGNKATEIKENVKETVDEVQKATNSVLNATDAMNQAVDDLKAIGE